jgi:hypothetical protein
MTRLRKIVFATALLAASAATASAQGYGHGYGSGHGGGYNSGYGARSAPNVTDMRQSRQVERIERGYRDGSLTPREAAGLMHQQREIAEYERRAKADGYLDPVERSNLRYMQDSASRSIRNERTDFEGRNAAFDRPWWRRWW